MKHTKRRKTLAAVLALALMLVGVGAAQAAAGPREATVIQAQNVDELVAALGSNVTVELAPGDYDLAAATTYGRDTGNPFCRWQQSSEEGYELVVSNADGLTIRGAGMDETCLLARDRYATVLNFTDCRALTLADFTAGHSPEPGFCSGGVVNLEGCDEVTVIRCGLFGCGTVGIWATGSQNVTITQSRIYECSESALSLSNCRTVLVEDCEIDHHGWKREDEASCLIQTFGGDGFTVTGCRIHDNEAYLLLQVSGTGNVQFLSNRVEYNGLDSVFALFDGFATVEGCRFYGNELDGWYALGDEPSLAARNRQGEALSEEDLNAMAYGRVQPLVAEEIDLPEPTEVAPGGEIVVHTVDELIAALGPDRTITLDADAFALAEAGNYGDGEGRYYHWEDTYDGPQLIITGVSNLTIRAATQDPAAVTLTAAPRYANVLFFQNCDRVTVSGFTLGHSQGLGECTGGVVALENCDGVTLDHCRLYGCGTLGLDAMFSSEIKLAGCEIYDCSMGGVSLYGVRGASFEECHIHDVPSPALSLFDCSGVLWNGSFIRGDQFDVTSSGALVPVVME